MEAQAPSPQTTLLILLGASAWPFSPEFSSSPAFANAARRLKAYFLNPWPFGLPSENVLDLFDSDKSADELDVEIGQFLGRRLADLKQAGHPARDLLLYFIGHGGFVGHDADLYFAIRRTRMDNPRVSGLQVMALADTLTERARFLRRIIILDCCFAAAAFSAFQSGPDQVALEKAATAFLVSRKAVGFPTKGTTLLCSSSHKSPSLLLPDGSSTMFTKAFLDALVQGASSPRDHLTLRDVKDLAADLLSEIRNAPRPVVLSPDQSEGDVADVPFFPNPGVQEEQARKEEEERQRRAEEERRRREEEAMQARQADQESRRGRIEEEPHAASIQSGQSLPSSIPAPVPSPAPSPTRTPRKVSRRTVLLGLAVGGVIVAGGGVTWLLASGIPWQTSGGSSMETITGKVVSVNVVAHSVVVDVNGLQYTVGGLTDQQVATLQSTVGKTWSFQVTGSNGSYTVAAGTTPQEQDNGTPASNATP